MRIPVFVLALAALATAVKPPKHKEFAVGFTLGLGKGATELVGFININDTNPDSIVLIGNPPNTSDGTPAYFNGTGNKLALVFDETPSRDPDLRGLYGAHVPDPKTSYGKVNVVNVIRNYQDFNFSVKNGTISHKLYSANNAFFACNRTLFPDDDTLYYTLSFGNYNKDHSAPAGCLPSRVLQIFNVPVDAQPPK